MRFDIFLIVAQFHHLKVLFYLRNQSFNFHNLKDFDLIFQLYLLIHRFLILIFIFILSNFIFPVKQCLIHIYFSSIIQFGLLSINSHWIAFRYIGFTILYPNCFMIIIAPFHLMNFINFCFIIRFLLDWIYLDSTIKFILIYYCSYYLNVLFHLIIMLIFHP